jgi:geranylgeranyl diphosphate synthase, type II
LPVKILLFAKNTIGCTVNNRQFCVMNISEILAGLEAEIAKLEFGQNPKQLYEPLRYIMRLGGKRIRPFMAVMAYNIYKNDWPQILKPALALEVFHNFTLLHDDLMDAAPSRRGQTTVHERWNPNTAILSGDVMLVKAYEMFLDLPQAQLAQVLATFSKIASQVCEGQQFDMDFEKAETVSKADYLEMIRLKTSVLLGFALQLGGMLAMQSSHEQHILYQIGEQAGLGFQLMDDLLDVYGKPEKFGKQIAGDILANKKTWLLLDAQQHAKGQNKKTLEYWLTAQNYTDTEKIQAVTNLYNELGVRQRAEQLASGYFETALGHIESLSGQASAKEQLRQFFVQLMSRES